ncbi:MAG: pyridoxal-phosphate dependent enzyme [Bacteroidetes bacterium]|nr:MAG: pyridoxal-phosphate dependent enzyme [Bacteroidota bacterium]
MFKLPTPINPIYPERWEEWGMSLFLKRDDLIHELVSGNKWRKLKPILDYAAANKVSVLESMGGAYSNHLLALAVVAKAYGFRARGFVRGEEVNNPVLSLCKAQGMELEFISRTQTRQWRSERNELELMHNQLWIPEGAACELGRSGMQSLWLELKEEFSDVVDCVGSGTSVMGLAQFKPENTRLHAVMCVKDKGLADKLSDGGMEVHRGFERGGFAKVDHELIQACADFELDTGILLDPIYTSKMWLAVLDLIQKGYFPKGSKVLMVHSGGLQGWLGDGLMQNLMLLKRA